MSAGPEVVVDGRVIGHPTAGSRGIGRYVVALVGALKASGVEVRVLVDSESERRAWLDRLPDIDVRSMSPGAFREVPHRAWFLCTQLMLHPIPLDVIPRAVTEAGLRVMAVMYDVIPQRWPERYLTTGPARNMSRLRCSLARTVDHFLAISRFTAVTAAIELGVPDHRFTVIGSAVDAGFSPDGGSDDGGLDDGSVVANTGPDPRKNTEGLIRAWSMIPAGVRQGRRLRVVCAIPDTVRRDWRRLVDDLGLDDVELVGAVDDVELRTLYQRCSLAVFPSLEEGFGLPVAEAAACGAPVVCSDVSSMPEVIGCDEALFNPYDVGDMARVIEQALVDAALRTRLLEASAACAARWTWSRVGAAARAALAGPAGFRRIGATYRRRVALVGRADPELVAAWPGGSTVETVDDVSGTDRAASGWNAWGWGRFTRAHDFDAVVTRITDAGQGATMARMSDDPGHVWVAAGVEIPPFAIRARSVIVESADDTVRVPAGIPVMVLRGHGPRERAREVADWVNGAA